MAFKVEANIDTVRKLITCLTGCELRETNFKRYESAALSASSRLCSPVLDKTSVEQHLENLILRYEVDGFVEKGTHLKELFAELITNIQSEDMDVYRMISVLLNLAQKPSKSHTYQHVEQVPRVITPSEEDGIDWSVYLREGDHEFFDGYGSPSSDEGEFISKAEPTENIPGCSFTDEVHTTSVVQDVDGKARRNVDESWISTHMQRIGESYLWLEMNVQPQWWNSNKAQQTSNIWEQIVAEDAVTKLTEYKVLREMLFFLQALPSSGGRVFIKANGKFVVSPDITVSDVSKDIFQQSLRRICHIFDIISELEEFKSDLYLYNSDEPPPSTYLGWFDAASVYLGNMRKTASEIEKLVFKQESTHTLLSVLHILEPHFLILDNIYSLFKKCMFFPLKSNPNWLCSACMLSSIFDAIGKCKVAEDSNMYLLFLLKSLELYMNITGVWLTQGTIIDDTDEYFITGNGETFELRPFCEMLNEANLQPSKLLKDMAERILTVGRVITFLIRLEKVEEKERKKLSYKLFYDGFISHLMNRFEELESVESCSAQLTERKLTSTPHDGSGDYHALNCLKSSCDSLMLMAFEDRTAEIKKFNEHVDSIFKRLSFRSSTIAVPLHAWLKDALNHVLAIFYSEASHVIEDILFGLLKLSEHLTLVKEVMFAFAADDFLKCLFSQVESGAVNPISLSFELEEYVEKSYPQLKSGFEILFDNRSSNVIKVPKKYLLKAFFRKGLEILNLFKRIYIKYQVQWPLTLIFSDSSMMKYNSIFQALIKVKWALHLLHQLHFQEPANKYTEMRSNLHRLQILKFWILNTMTTIHSYLFQCIHAVENIHVAKNMDEVIEAHDAYVTAVCKHVLEPGNAQDIMTNFHDLVLISYMLHELWLMDPLLLSPEFLNELEKMYGICHHDMISKLTNKFDEGFDLYSCELWPILVTSDPPFYKKRLRLLRQSV